MRQLVLISAAGAAALLAAGAVAQTTGVTTRTLSTIDWPRAEEDASAAGLASARPSSGLGLQSFGGARAAGATNLQIPLLMPQSIVDASSDGLLEAPLELIARTNDYSAEARWNGRSYQIDGTRVVFELADAPGEPEAPDSDVFVEVSDYGVNASFERYGANYSITIYCDEPLSDPECASEDRVRELAAEMTFTP